MKKIFSLTLILVFTLSLLTACNQKSNKGNAENTTVRVSYGTALCHAPVHVALTNGFFEEEGLDVDAIPMDTAATVDGAASGQIDAGYGLFGKFAQPLENGLPIKFTTGMHTGCIKIVTSGDSQINSVSELRGMRIGVSSLSDSPAIITMRALAKEGIGVTAENMEVELIVFANSDLPAALANGSIDAYASMDPTVSVAVKEHNLKVLLDTATSEDFADEYCCAAFVTSEFAAEHPDLAAKYTRALMNASLWIAQHPEETAQLQADNEYVAGDVEFNAELLRDYEFTPAVEEGYDSLAKTLDALKDVGVLKSGTDSTKLAEDSFIFFDNFDDPIRE